MIDSNWENRYLEGDTPWESGKSHEEMQRLFNCYIPTNANVLEVGCGYGTNARWLASAGYRITAVDISDTAIEEATRISNSQEHKPDFRTIDFFRDWASLPVFDAIFDCAVLHFMSSTEERIHMAQCIASRLNPGGWWINIACSQDESAEICEASGVRPPPCLKAIEIIEAIEPVFEIVEMHKCKFQVDRKEEGKAEYNAWGSAFKKRK